MNHTFADDPIRRSILSHVIQHDTEALCYMVSDAAVDLVPIADEEMLEDIIWPFFYYSSYSIKRMAAEILGLPVEEDYELPDLLRRLEVREVNEPNELPAGSNWTKEGF